MVQVQEVTLEKDAMWDAVNKGPDPNVPLEGGGETEAQCAERGARFMRWLMARYAC